MKEGVLVLDKQINILSVDTGNFYSNKEARLHWKNHKLRAERNRLINGGQVVSANGIKRTIIGLKEIEEKINKHGVTISDLDKAKEDENGLGFTKFGDNQEVLFNLYDKRILC